MWPAAILLFGFVWMGRLPRRHYLPVLGFVPGVHRDDARRHGVLWPATWNANGEFLAVYFGSRWRIAPFARDDEGRVVARPPLAGLPGTEPKPGLVAFLMVLIGSTSFDGRRDVVLVRRPRRLGRCRTGLVGTAGLLAMIRSWPASTRRRCGRPPRRPARSGVRSGAVRALARADGPGLHRRALRLFLLLEGELGPPLLSDPFGFGWNLFGTATWTPNFSLIRPPRSVRAGRGDRVGARRRRDPRPRPSHRRVPRSARSRPSTAARGHGRVHLPARGQMDRRPPQLPGTVRAPYLRTWRRRAGRRRRGLGRCAPADVLAFRGDS